MQTDIHHQQATVVLKDGNTQLATWIHPGDPRPTVGEFLDIPAQLMTDLAGYEPRAVVSRIGQREGFADLIELEATCQMKIQDRTVIVLNSSRIRESLRETAETHLRSTLRYPLIHWEPSAQPDPVVRFHDPVTGRKACPPEVRSGLLDLLYRPISV